MELDLGILTELDLARRKQQTLNSVYGVHEIDCLGVHVLKLANLKPIKNLVKKTIKTIVHESVHGVLTELKLSSFDNLIYYYGYSSNPNFKNCFINCGEISEKLGLI